MTRLVELKAMLDEGLIDRAEFEVLKADILGAASPPASVPSATQRPLQPEISKPPAADSKPPAPSAYRPTEQVFSVRYRIKTSLLGVALSSRGAEASFTMVSLPAGSFSMGSPDDEPHCRSWVLGHRRRWVVREVVVRVRACATASCRQ